MNKTLANLLTFYVPVRGWRRKIRWKLMAPTYWTPYVTDYLGGDFKDYLLKEDIPARTALLKSGLPPRSVELVDVLLRRFVVFPDLKLRSCLKVDYEKFFETFAVAEEREFRAYEDAIPGIGGRVNRLRASPHSPTPFATNTLNSTRSPFTFALAPKLPVGKDWKNSRAWSARSSSFSASAFTKRRFGGNVA